jgi:patatin-like phospholipase/acyl hydrolase
MENQKLIYKEIKSKIIELDNLIKDNHENVTNVNENVLSIFSSINKIIREVDEDEDANFFYNLKYIYHLNRANYFNLIGNNVDADKQKEFGKRYEKKIEIFMDSCDQQKASDESFKFDGSKEFKEINKPIENEFEILRKSFVNDDSWGKFFDDMKAEFDEIGKIPSNIDEYFKHFEESGLKKMLSELEAIIIETFQVDDECEPIYKSFKRLKLLFETKEYIRKIKFMECVNQLDFDSDNALYGGIPNTAECIKKRFHKISMEFHPDKTQWRLKAHEYLSCQLFGKAEELKEKKLDFTAKKSKSVGVLNYNENEGDRYLRICRDYEKALEAKIKNTNISSDDLKEINYRDLCNLTNAELKSKRDSNAIKSYEFYRSACKIADKNNLLDKQCKFRQNLATCLNFAELFLEARVCAFSAIYIILKNNHDDASGKLLQDAQKFFSELNAYKIENTTVKSTTNQNEKKSMQLVPVNSNRNLSLSIRKSFSTVEREQLKNNLEVELRSVIKELMIKPNENIVKYQTLIDEKIIQTSSKAKIFRNTFFYNEYVSSLVFRDKPRKEYNEIIKAAVDKYKEGNLLEFFEKLQTSNQHDDNRKILDLDSDKSRGVVLPYSVIETLNRHGYRPDGIAYLLILIGETLLSNKVNFKNRTQKDFDGQAVTVFEATFMSELLNTKAKNLDDLIEEKRNKQRSRLRDILGDIWDLVHIIFTKAKSDEKLILKDYIKDSQEMAFVERLTETQNIAKINIALIRIMQSDLNAATQIIKEIRDIPKKKFSFISPSIMRLEILEDLISIIDGTYIETTENDNKVKEMSHAIELNDKYIHYLSEKLNIEMNSGEKARIYKQIAVYYEFNAKKLDKENKLVSINSWKFAKNNYHESIRCYKKDCDVLIGYANCLVGLNKYNLAKEFLDKYQDLLKSRSDYWLIKAVVSKKQNRCTESKDFLRRCLKDDPENQKAQSELKLIDKLSINNLCQKIYISSSLSLSFDQNYYSRMKNNKNIYRILSIDGGGMRGIIPAFWLNEIERQTNKPICHLFNMISGTSTGAIIAAGLVTPKNEYTPLYRAYDIVQLYQTCGEKIFTKAGKSEIFNAAYTDLGRLNLFRDYFKEAKLDRSLVDLIIPAVNESFLNLPHLFSTFEARKDPFKNVSYVDALMATTAAPTFFPPYKINNEIYLDGGIHANNPAQIAYDQAVKNGVRKENIQLISMGTGDYIPDPLNTESDRGWLFWGRNLQRVAFSAQAGTSDQTMQTSLGSKYKRWQTWFENPIGLDDYSDDSIIMMQEMANQYIEEVFFNDENLFRKLSENLPE